MRALPTFWVSGTALDDHNQCDLQGKCHRGGYLGANSGSKSINKVPIEGEIIFLRVQARLSSARRNHQNRSPMLKIEQWPNFWLPAQSVSKPDLRSNNSKILEAPNSLTPLAARKPCTVHWNRTLPNSYPLSPMAPPLQRLKESPATCQAVPFLLHSWHLAFYSLPVTRRQQSWPPNTFCCESSLWKIRQKILNPANHFKEPFNSFHSGWYFF